MTEISYNEPPTPVLGVALVAMALVAGLIYAFSVAVMPNLPGADNRTLRGDHSAAPPKENQ